MRKYIVFVILIVLSACGKNEVDNISKAKKTGEGVCLYPLDYHQLSLDYHINLNNIILPDKPLISYNDILGYDTAQNVLLVKKPILDSLDFPRAWVITVDRKPVYGGWTFYNYMSSVCPWVCVVPDDSINKISAGKLKIRLGYPNKEYFEGTDPRKNSLLINRLLKDKKIK